MLACYEFMHIPIVITQNYPLCRLQLLRLDTQRYNQPIEIVQKSSKPTNNKALL